MLEHYGSSLSTDPVATAWLGTCPRSQNGCPSLYESAGPVEGRTVSTCQGMEIWLAIKTDLRNLYCPFYFLYP